MKKIDLRSVLDQERNIIRRDAVKMIKRGDKKKDIAVLFISHRLHTLKNMADRIYVLENGIITSSGNHQKLLETTNFYSEFWEEIVV